MMITPDHKIRVLIADDDALLRDIAVATFEGAGFDVRPASGRVARAQRSSIPKHSANVTSV